MSVILGPSAKQLEVILSELNETEERLEYNVRELKSWCASQPHLPDITDEQLLRVFLRGCRQDLARTRAKIECFCRARVNSSDIYLYRQVTSGPLQRVQSYIDIVPLPRLTEEGCRVTLLRIRPDFDYNIFSVPDIIRYMYLVADVRIHDEAPIAGDMFLWDLAGARVALAAHVAGSAVMLRRAMHLAHTAYPQRMKRAHLLNAPAFLASTVTLMRSFLKEKIRNRFMLHSSLESLHEHISLDVLPADYGGREANMQTLLRRWTRRITELQPYLQSLEYLRARGEKPASNISKDDYLFGTAGAFRSLNID